MTVKFKFILVNKK